MRPDPDLELDVDFPLTPSLFPRERENRCQGSSVPERYVETGDILLE